MTCITPKKTACGTDKFDISTTGVPFYDAMLGKEEIVGKYEGDPKGYFRNVKGIEFTIECLTPDDYFIEVAKFHDTTAEIEKTKIMRDWVDSYKTRTLKCSPMPLPILDYKERIQEGRHRVIVASELGIKKIPVLVVKKRIGLKSNE